MSREPHRSKGTGWGSAAALLPLLVAACPGCPPGVAPPTTDVGAQHYESPELVPGYTPKCPGHLVDFQMVVDSGTHGEHDWKLITVTDIPLSGELDDVPEAHDCQRLVVPNGNALAFGPLAAIFAADALDAKDFYAGRQGEGVRAVATIYANSTGYEPLRIAAGVNCLYVFPTGGGLAARMIQVRHPQDCDLPLLDPRPDHALEVRLDPMAGPPSEIPAVARWDGNFAQGGRKQHHIGVRCGDGWCEIGPRGFLSAPPRDVGMVSRRTARRSAAAPGQADAIRVVRNRGWYDEQLLAVEPTTAGAPLEVGPVLATLLPHPQLAQLTTAEDFKPSWVEVATAYLPDGIPGYKTKLNLEAGVNVFEMRMATRAALVAEGTTISSECTGGDAGEAWWIRVTSAGSRDQSVYCATRFSHDGKSTRLPGVVRWQWLEDDEKTWFACDQGCCYRQ